MTVQLSPIANARIGFVGKLGGMNRKELRRLVREYGGVMVDPINDSVNLIVIGESGLPIDDFDFLVDPNLTESAEDGRTRIVTETQFWQELGLVEDENGACRLYTSGMLAQLLDVPVATIRRWHRRGLIAPSRQVHRLAYFDFQEVASARRIAELMSAGASPDAIELKLSRLAELYPELQRPLSQLNVIIEGRNVLLRDGAGLIEPGGQKRFDFAPDKPAAEDEAPQVLSIESAADSKWDLENLSRPEQFLKLAAELEDDELLESAAVVYRAMLLAFGPSADGCFRLAETLFQLGDLGAARERYYMAVEIDQEFVEARASLGCVLVELGQLELGLSAFQGALDHHPEYPDVLFHTARLLDQMNREEEAESHWKQFLDMAPKSPWADEARQRLGLEEILT